MLKKTFQIIGIFILAGFSFFYTEKVNQIVKDKDPIMIKINEIKSDSYVSLVKPIINNDEYISGLNGCEVDVNKSYNKMKDVGEFKDELIVMKEVENNDNLNNKYIVGANKNQKNVSIIFFIKDKANNNLIEMLKNKKIIANFFIDQSFLENNTITVKFISENNNIYYLGNNGKYEDKYMIYSNNLIEMNSKNKSNYCFVSQKQDNVLKLCSEYNMKTIKSEIIKDNLLSNVREKLNNGSIISIESSDIDEIKVTLNYIISKGYNIISLDKLLNQNNKCNK